MKKLNNIMISCIILIFYFSSTQSSSCMKIPLKKFDQVAGIVSVPINDDANLPTLLKPTCISHGPAIHVKMHDAHINLLNSTISDASCNHLYETLLCKKTKPISKRNCRNAHLIILAILQKLPECQNDGECFHEYDIGEKIECEWMKELQDDVCMEIDDSFLNCDKNVSSSIHIEDFCYLTNPMCSFIVNNVVPISITTGVIWGLTTICFIYFCQSMCDGFTATEQIVENAYSQIYDQRKKLISEHIHTIHT